MGILSPIVQTLVLTMIANGEANLSLCCTIRTQFVGDHDTWRSALTRQKFAHETLGSLGITPSLDKNIQHKAILINSAPKKVAFAVDRDNRFIKMPPITKAWCATAN